MSQQRILIVAAHPDDEVLGCGATVAKRVQQGAETRLLTLTAGIGGRHASADVPDAAVASAQASLREEMNRAAAVLGITSVECLGFPDNRMDTIGRMDVAREIAMRVADFRPQVIFTHHPGDYNWDHGVTFDAVMMAARSSPGEFRVDEILTFEVPSSTERGWQDPSRSFHPNVYVNVARTIDQKKLALRYYETEYREYPHPRSIEALEYLARKRGYEVGLEYAEAFHLVRRVDD